MRQSPSLRTLTIYYAIGHMEKQQSSEHSLGVASGPTETS
jgi:hypothetical protein